MPENLPEYQLRESQEKEPTPHVAYRFGPHGIGKLTEAITKARPKFEAIKKSAENPFYKDTKGKARKYADLNEIISATADALAEQGVHIYQFPDVSDRLVSLTSLVVHVSGEWLEATIKDCPAEQKTEKGTRHDAQTIGIAITYLRRYTQQSIFNLGSEDDDGQGIVQQPEQKIQKTPHFVTGMSITGKGPSAVPRPENGQITVASQSIPTVQVYPADPRKDTDGCPVSDSDLPKDKAYEPAPNGDPLPTADQKKTYAGFLRSYKQDSRALKNWVEKETNAEYNKISNLQFNQLFVKLDKAMKDGGPEGVTKLISNG